MTFIHRFSGSVLSILACLGLCGCLVCSGAPVSRDRQAETGPLYGRWRSSRLGGGGYLQNVVCCPSDASRYYTYCDVGGVFRSDDGGRSWRMLHGGLPPKDGYYQTRGLIVHPRNADDILIAVGDKGASGLFRSLDGGRTWSLKQQALFFGNGPRRAAGLVLARHPAQPSRVLAASAGDGVWQSDDGGDSWRNIGLKGLYPTDIRYDRANPDCVWLCSHPLSGWRGTFGGAFHRSLDGGKSWEKLADEAPDELLQGSDPSRLYGLFDYQKICVSLDAGSTWRAVTDGLPSGSIDVGGKPTSPSRFNALAAGPGFVLTASAEGTFYRLASGTSRWEVIKRQAIHDEDWWGAYRPGKWRHFGKALGSITVDPRDPQHWFFTDWYALYQSSDGGQNWDLSIDGIEVTVIHTFAQDPTRPSLLHMGMADNGYLVSEDGGRSFRKVELPGGGGNVKHVVVAPSDPERLYIAACRKWDWRSDQVYISHDHGLTWRRSPMRGLPQGEEYNFNTLAVSADNPDHVALAASGPVAPGKGGPYLSIDGGDTWKWMGQGLPTGKPLYASSIWDGRVQLAAGRGLGFVTVVGGNGDHAFRYDAPTDMWVPVDICSGKDRPSCVVSIPQEQGCIYFSCGPYGVSRSSDSGLTWTRVYTKGASRIAIDQAVPRRVALGTGTGLLVSQDGGDTWMDYTPDLPRRTHPKPVFCGDQLVVGTAGNGAFWTPLQDSARAE